jgi:hypothetical protein
VRCEELGGGWLKKVVILACGYGSVGVGWQSALVLRGRRKCRGKDVVELARGDGEDQGLGCVKERVRAITVYMAAYLKTGWCD